MVNGLEELVEGWRREDEEAREARRRSADWSYIERQKEPIKTALKLMVETGDLWVAARIAGLPIDEFNRIRMKAKIPIVV
jgi:hypothetical protein